MVVDSVVQVAHAGVGAVSAACLTAEDLVAAAVRDVAEFLDVDVDQVAGCRVFVAADDPACGAVEVGEAGQAVAGQDAVDGGRVQPEEVGDTSRPPAAQDADLDDPALGACRGPARAVVRAGGTVGHARLAEQAVTPRPAGSGGDRYLKPFRGPAERPSVLDDAAGQTQAAGLGQGCITVGHEGLLIVRV
jgi:hypothetical protein